MTALYGVMVIPELERTEDHCAIRVVVANTRVINILRCNLLVPANTHAIQEDKLSSYIPSAGRLAPISGLAERIATCNCAASCNALSEGKALNHHVRFYIGLFQCVSPPS